jgi:hypothetical protein
MSHDSDVIREMIAEALERKWAHDHGLVSSGTALQVWRPYATAVLALFDVGREGHAADGRSRVVLTLAPAVPGSDHG